MYKLLLIVSITFCNSAFGQVSGVVIDQITSKPLPYIDIWKKGTSLGTTSDVNGKFFKSEFTAGDTIIISNVGFIRKELIFQDNITIALEPKIVELSVVNISNKPYIIKDEFLKYTKKDRAKKYYFSGSNVRYVYAKYFSHRPDKAFIDKLSFSIWNRLEANAMFKIELVIPDESGKPSHNLICKPLFPNVKEGKSKLEIDLKHLNLEFPVRGLFVIIQTLDLKKNRNFSRYSEVAGFYFLEPSFGIDNAQEKDNTWILVDEIWYPPSLAKMFTNQTQRNLDIEVISFD